MVKQTNATLPSISKGGMPSLNDKEEEVPPNAAEATEGKMLLLTVSAGKLGLTIRADTKLGGVTITAIDPSCTFKDRVEIGDRLVTVDGQKITKIADLQINNTKQRQFGVVKKIVQQTTEKNQRVPPPSSTETAAANAASTPKANNSKGNPVVTTEKTTTAKKNAKKQNEALQVIITCPDGSKINLSSDLTKKKDKSVVLGRGKHGIPSKSSSKMLVQACALRIVSPNGVLEQSALELVALGTESCTVIRDGKKFLYVTSVAQMLNNGMDITWPSSIKLRNGDIVQPFDRRSLIEPRYEFKIEIVAGGDLPPATAESDDTAVVDGSAFAAASKRINEAAARGGQGNPYNPYAKVPEAKNTGGKSSDARGETAVTRNLFDFDKETLRQTFLERPNTTTHFFLEYYKTLSKKNSTNANTRLGDNVLTTFINAMSPQDVSTLDSNMVLSGTVESFPLEQILEVLLQGKRKHTRLGKRAIEGYLWLSCRKYKRMHSGVDEPTGPTLLASQNFPLFSMCNSIGWDYLETLLVESMEMMCKYSRTPFRSFALLAKIEPTASSGSWESAQLRVFSRLAKIAYLKWFTAEPVETANKFVEQNRRIRKQSHNASDKLINAFVDAMSPSDSASRRVPLKSIDYSFPLRSILSTIPSDGKHKELGKRVLEGYVWLSCQKYSSISKPRGPEKLAGTLDIACKTIGWGLLADVLVESVEKLCEFNNTTEAFELMEAISRTPSSGEESQRSLICARVAKLTTKMLTIDRFRSNPNSTSKFFVTQYRHLEKDSSNKQFCTELLNCFVDIMSPRDPGSCRQLAVQLHHDFPLKDILRILVDGGHMEFGKRVLTGYLWLSSQRVSYYVDGPRLLDTVDVLLIKLCNALGWNEFENALVESVEMLCKYRSSREAVSFVDKIAPDVSEGSSHRHRICSKMAKIACDTYIESLNRGRHQYKSASDLPVYKKLLWLVGNYCPAIAPKFVSLVKKFDVDALLYPLVTDVALRSGSSADSFKNTLSEVTNYCAQMLSTRVGSDPDVVTAWTVSNSGLGANLAFGGFLQSQCKKTFDWRVRKSDHKGFLAVLRPLINAGEITCTSYQPGYSGPYHFKITKLKTCRVALSALSCSCSSRRRDAREEPSSCLRQSSQKERREDKAKLDAIKVYLTPEQIRGLSSQKRKADALDGDDDDVVFTGVAGVEETVAKRVKAAEDAGEVIEIL